jgi:hypothetical protein
VLRRFCCYLTQVARAEQTVKQIDLDIAELQKTLTNIEAARPVEELSVSHHMLLLINKYIIFTILFLA